MKQSPVDGERYVTVEMSAELWSYVIEALNLFITGESGTTYYELVNGGVQLRAALSTIERTVFS